MENILKNRGVEVTLVNIHDAVMSARLPFCVVCSNPCNTSCYTGTPLESAFECMADADAVVVGSPVYFGGPTAQIKAFFDKTRALRGKKALVGKIAAAVTVGGSRFGGQEAAAKAIHDLFLVQGMSIVGDGATDFDAGHHGVCAQRPSSEDEVAIKRIPILAQRIIDEINR